MMSIAESFRRFRRSQGLSQQAMADKLGIKQGSYTVYENRGGAPNVKTLIKMATEFNISVDYLLGLTDDPRPLKATVEVPANEPANEEIDIKAAITKINARLDAIEAAIAAMSK